MIVAVNAIYAIAQRSLKKIRTSTGFEEHRTGNREVTGSNPVEVLNFVQASLLKCINCVHCDERFFIFVSFPQFIYDLFHISLTVNSLLENYCLNSL